MAKIAAKTSSIYLDQYALHGSLTSWSMDVTQELPVVTCFQDTGPRRITANYDHTHSHAGFFEPEGVASGGIDAVVDALRTGTDANHYLLRIPATLAEGVIGYEAIGKLSSQPRGGQIGNAQTLGFDLAGSDGLARVTVLRTATISGTGNSTGQNLGTTTSGQTLGAWFRCISGTFSGITMKIQESSDDAAGDAYSDVSGLTSGSMTAAGIVYVSTTAATEAWKRVVVSAFSGTSVVVLVTIGVVI